jgi:hypothetical protein
MSGLLGFSRVSDGSWLPAWCMTSTLFASMEQRPRSFVGSQRLGVGTGTRICLPSSDGSRPAPLLRIAYTKAGN